MRAAPIDVYVAAFAARCELMRRPGQPVVDEPGLRGLLASPADPFTRLLVTDDRAYDALAALLPDARAGMINVFATAGRCAALLRGRAAWRARPLTAMICRDLGSAGAAALPRGLTLRPVRRLADDAPDGVRLVDAVAAAMRADPAIDAAPDAFTAFLRGLPSSFRLFAAVDRTGAVRATSGCSTIGTVADVFFVNTDPDWRGRGVARAMTAAALRAARDAGATRACLDATDAGVPIYLRLGCEIAGGTTQFFPRPDRTP